MRIQRSLSGRFDATQAGVLSDRGMKPDQRGFSLIEVMVVVGIMGVILAIAMPAYSDWRERTAAKTAIDTLAAHLKQARIMAVSENRSVTVVLASGSYTIDSTGATPLVVDLGQYSRNLTLAHTGTATFSFGSGGTSVSKTITISNPAGRDWSVVINTVGRVITE